jgi:diguanylate cyclase (GGDEF)-like protein/PAS domain S-box-containing protein
MAKITSRASGLHSTAAMSFATSLLDNSDDMVAAIDGNLRFIAMNTPFRREFELVFGNAISTGQQVDEVLAHVVGDRDKAVALCRRALSGESFRVTEDFGDIRLLRKSYELAFSPIFDTFHQPVFAAIFVRDMTLARVSEQRFGPLLEAAPDATIIIRGDGTIDLANAHAERMFGYARHALIGHQVEMLIPQRFHARHVAQRHQFLLRPAQRPMGGGNTRLLGLRADGKEFPVEISLNPLDMNGENMVVAAIRDITVRQQTEDQLRALSKELEHRVAERTVELERANKAFRATFEQASVGIVHVAPGGSLLRVNQCLCNMVGYTKEEMNTLSFQDITHPDDIDPDLELVRQLLTGDISSYSLDKRYLHKNGETVWANLNVSLVRDDDGAPEYFISVVKDITDRKRVEADHRKSKERLELAIAATGLGLFDYAPQTGRTEWSPEMKHYLGLQPEQRVTYDLFLNGIHPDDRERMHDLLDAAMHGEGGGRFELEVRTIDADKRMRWLEGRGQVLFESGGNPTRCIGTVLDITDKKLAEQALRASEHQLRMMFEANPIGTVRCTPAGEVIEANGAYLRIIGRSREELRSGQIRWGETTPLEYIDADDRAIAQAQKHGVSELYEKEYVRPDGTRVPVLLACSLLGYDGDLAADGDLVAFVLDISDRKQAEEQVRLAALHDPLTGLPNRGLLFDYAKHVFGHARRFHRRCAVLFIDLDRFKPINDNYGHEVGDVVLQEVARRMTACTRAEDIVFRLGGDEFLILLPDIDDDERAGDVARHLMHSVHQPYQLSGFEVSLSASIGISLYPRDGEVLDTLINNADAAMYQAKQAGRNNVQFYSEELAARSQQQLRIEEQLKTALAHNAFELYYQPLVDTQTSRLMGVEALVRWQHAGIGPDQFVPVAEATGHINSLSDWVIEEACRQHKKWQQRGMPEIPIAINVSAVQFRQKDFAATFMQKLRKFAVAASALQVEVTETSMMENFDHAIEVLSELKSFGIKIALDDFGTGYSSLNYLSRLPINKIKVDKSFVQRIEHDATSRAITEAVIALGRSLSLEVVAEGIESERTLDYLRRHGCTQVQGFHICRPVTAKIFESWFAQHSALYGHGAD